MGTSTRDRMINDAMRMTYEDSKLTIWDKSGFELMSCIIEGGGGGGSTVKWSQIQTTGTKIAVITINGTPTDVYAPTGGGTNVRYEPGLLAGPLVGTLYLNNVPYELHCSEGGGGGSEVSWTQYVTEGTKIARIMVDGFGTDVYAPSGGGSGSVIWTPDPTTVPMVRLGKLKIDGVDNSVDIPVYSYWKSLKVDGSNYMEGTLHLAGNSIDTCSGIVLENHDPTRWGLRFMDIAGNGSGTLFADMTATESKFTLKAINESALKQACLVLSTQWDEEWAGPLYGVGTDTALQWTHLMTDIDCANRYCKNPSTRDLEMAGHAVVNGGMYNIYDHDLTLIREPSSSGSDGCKILMSDHILTLYVGNDEGSNFTALRLKGDPTGSSEVPYRPVVVHAFGSLEYETGVMLQTDVPQQGGNTDRPVYIKDNAFLIADRFASGTRVFYNGESKAGEICNIYGPERMGHTGEMLVGLNDAAAQWEDTHILKTIEVTWEHDIAAHGGYREAGVAAPTVEGYSLFAVGGTGCNSWECIIVAKPVSTSTYDINCVNVSDSDRHPFCWIRLVYAKNGWFNFD